MVCKRGKGLDLGAELPPSPLQNFVEVSLGGGAKELEVIKTSHKKIQKNNGLWSLFRVGLFAGDNSFSF